MKKYLSACVLGIVALSGCALLTSQGVVTPEQNKAACIDAATACVAAGAAGVTNDTVKKTCAAVAVLCAAGV